MKIQNNNNLSFNGIKISSAKFEDVREVAFDLARAGFQILVIRLFIVIIASLIR